MCAGFSTVRIICNVTMRGPSDRDAAGGVVHLVADCPDLTASCSPGFVV